LTQSARNYAFTGDKKWEERYREVEPKLDTDIKHAIEKGDEKDKEFFKSVDNANIALVEMEYQAIELVNDGKMTGAVRILESKEYWGQKTIYEQGLRDYVAKRGSEYDEALIASTETLDSVTVRTEELVRDNMQLVIVFILFGVILAIVIGTYIFYSISKPISKLQDAIKRIARGNLDVTIDVKGTDEISSLSNSFNKMKDSIKNTIELEKSLAVEKEKLKTERLTAIGELAANIAHDIRNPLFSIKNSNRLIKKMVHDEKGINEIMRIDRSVARITHQLNQVLDFVRKTPAKLEKFSLTHVLEGIIKTMKIPPNISINMPQTWNYTWNTWCITKRRNVL